MSSTITEMDARDLIGRLVTNPNGAEFVVTRLSFEATLGRIMVWIEDVEEGGEVGLLDLDGWTIHQPLPLHPPEADLRYLRRAVYALAGSAGGERLREQLGVPEAEQTRYTS
jgi:hypothetical protein